MKRIIILLLLFLQNAPAWENNDTILLGSYVGYLPPYLYWLTSERTNDSFDDVIKKISENKFIRWGQNRAFTKGITNQSYWILIKVKDTSTSNTIHKYLWSHYVTSCKYEYYELDSALKLLNH